MKNLKQLRLEKNLSQQKLADILHISQQSVYKYENDITMPDIETLINISNYFETSIDYVVGNTNIPHKIEERTAFTLNDSEQKLVENYRKLSPSQRSLLDSIAKSYLVSDK